jgi:LPXTG-site transpeptidase (sortase) family protein
MSDIIDFFRVRPKKRIIKIKRKFGVIFTNPKGVKKAVFYVSNLIIVLAFGYLLYLYWPLAGAVITYADFKAYSKSDSLEIRQISPIPTPMELAKTTDDFWVQIPRINAKSNIVANVSPNNRTEYLKVLENNVIAQAKTSDLPNQGLGKSTYLFAHSTSQGLSMIRKNAIFYLLGELKTNDQIFLNYHGEILSYQVYDQKIVAAGDIQYLNYSDPEKEVLILQTCWPIGTDWKRLLIFAKRI